MDEILKKAIALAVPFLLFRTSVQATGKTGNGAIWSGLQRLGGPFSLAGGLIVLAIALLVASALIHIIFDGFLIKLYQHRRQFLSPESLVSQIDRLPFSTDLKIKLKWGVLHPPMRAFPRWERGLTWGFPCAIAGVTAGSLLGYMGEFHQLFELTSHFKLQYLIAAWLLLVYFAIKRQKFLISVSLFCVAINLAEIVPWYLPNPAIAASPQATAVRVVQVNVWGRNKQYDKVLDFVRKEKPAIAAFMEVSDTWAQQLETLQDILPYSHRAKGVALYSSLPLERIAVDWGVAERPTIIADVTLEKQTLSILAAHSHIPTGRTLFKKRNQSLQAIANTVAQRDNPAIVVGDLNITMWSPYYKKMVKTANLRNARSGFGILPTWPTRKPLLLIPIDCCLVTPEIQVVNTRRGPNVGSDHFPMVTDLAIENL